MIYVKAVLHPHTVKWGVNTYHLSLGGVTELLHSPNASSSSGSGGGVPKRTKSTDIPVAVVNPAFSEAELSEVVTLKTNSVATSKEHGWRHVTQNGYIRGPIDQQHIPLISDT